MISVCIATFNGEEFIEDQLESVLCQLSGDDEVVISDDGSTDNTVAVIKAIDDKRIRWAGIGGQLGVVKNFERALAAAKGEFVFLCDQDDIWLPDKVDQCVEALQTYMLVVTDCVVVDSSLAEISPSFFAMRNSGKGLLRNLWKNSYLGCCMAFRKELLDICLPIPSSVPMHDMWLGMLGGIQGEVLFFAKKCSLYRRHSAAASQTAGKSTFGLCKRLHIRFILAAHIFRRLFAIKIQKIFY